MDWSKAKSILIFAFLITNIILISVLLSKERQVEPTIKPEFIEEATRILKSKDISIDTEIPREIPSLNSLIVEYETIDISKINQEFFLNQGLIDESEEDTVKILGNNESVWIKNKKKLRYENKEKENKYTILTEELAEKIALEFLRDKKYDMQYMELSYIKKRENGYYLSFSRVYNERYLETAYINVLVDSRGVKELESLLLNIESAGETLININTAPKAILSLLSMEEVYGKTIIDISLCYYFNPEGHEYIENPQKAKKGKTIPAWRIIFDDGHKVIIDNY